MTWLFEFVMGPEDLTGDRPPRKQPVLIRSKNRSIKKALPVSAEPVKPIEEEASSKQPGDSSGNLQKWVLVLIVNLPSYASFVKRKKADLTKKYCSFICILRIGFPMDGPGMDQGRKLGNLPYES